MKKILFALVLALQSLLGTEALAAPCTTSTLAAYLGLGSSGCTIGSFRFSDFGLLTPPTGSIPFRSVTVTPVAVGMSIGLDFGVSAGAGAGVLLDDLISYRISGIGASLDGASLFFTGSSTTGDGAVTVVENLCVGGLFLGADGVSGCSGTPRNLIVVDTFGSTDPLMSLAFLSALSLAVVTDIGVDGGTAGSASLISASNRFRIAASRVPEPSPLLLVVAGLLALFGSGAARRLRVSRLAGRSAFRV